MLLPLMTKSGRFRAASLFSTLVAMLLAGLLAALFPVRADSDWFRSSHSRQGDASKGPVMRNYSADDRVRYQLWNYSWHPNPDQPITHIKISIGDQKVYVYQGDALAAESPVTTGKPGHDTPPGHYEILVKDIDHNSNLYGIAVDAQGNVIDDNASAGQKLPQGAIYDSADMPYYMRLREDGVGMHGGYLPGYPASHGCIRLPHAFAELLYSNVSVGTPVDIVP
jgi:lipoprotein-anchoring transpeptidase ErfK/SrfK